MIHWCLLMERSIQEHAVDAMLDVATFAGHKGYVRLSIGYTRVDVARNTAVAMFQEPKPAKMRANSPDDYLVMLDGDHCHPYNILDGLTRHDLPVVGALAFRRAEPYDPLIFREDANGKLKRIDHWTGGLMQVEAVGFGAIAIKRRVFDQLAIAGYEPPYFRFDYRLNNPIWSFGEDLYFAELCKKCDIAIYCDTDIVTPHLTVREIVGDEWADTHPSYRLPDFSRLAQQLLPGGRV